MSNLQGSINTKINLSGGLFPMGTKGYSAYEVAVQQGFKGTVDEWLESLVGPQGEPGKTGEQGPTGPQGIQGIQGIQGDSGVYIGDEEPTDEDVMVWIDTDAEADENGATFTPTVSSEGVISWSNDKGLTNPTPVNIRGPQGIQGEQGEPGPQGETGPKGEKGEDAYIKITDRIKELDITTLDTGIYLFLGASEYAAADLYYGEIYSGLILNSGTYLMIRKNGNYYTGYIFEPTDSIYNFSINSNMSNFTIKEFSTKDYVSRAINNAIGTALGGSY